MSPTLAYYKKKKSHFVIEQLTHLLENWIPYSISSRYGLAMLKEAPEKRLLI